MSAPRPGAPLRTALVLSLALWFGTAAAADPASQPPPPYAQLFEAVVDLVRASYWDPDHLDWDAWAARFRDEAVASDDRATFDAVMGRMLWALGDGHSRWLGVPAPTGQVGADAVEELPLRIGCVCVFVPDRGILVERVYAGTPAEAAGLLRGDVVVAVDGVPLSCADTLVAANESLRAALERGQTTLSVERGRRSVDVTVEGARLPIADVAARPYGVMLDAATAYVYVPSFQQSDVAAQTHALLAALQTSGAVGLVLDLRANPGGRLLEAGVLLASLLDGPWAAGVAHGSVAWSAEASSSSAGASARLVSPEGQPLGALEVADAVRWQGPVVVVVDRATTSVAEVVAAALQRSGRASVVGERTPGNVEAVQGFTLGDGSRVVLAVADLRAPDGTPYSGGVVPDVVSVAEREALERGRDLPVLEARRLLGSLPFVPDRRF